jgi:hypothetical protein
MKGSQRSSGVWKPALLLTALLVALAAACTQVGPTEAPTPTPTALQSAEEAGRAAPGAGQAAQREKAKGVIKEGATGGRPSIIIQTEQGATLTLTLNADTQYAINEPGVGRSRVASLSELVVGATVEVEYTSDGVALAILAGVAIPKFIDLTETALKAKGIVTTQSAGSSGEPGSITIQTEQGSTLTLTLNADTQYAIGEEGVQRLVASVSDLPAGATVEVEYTSDGVALRLVVNDPGLPAETTRTPAPR